MDMVKSFALSLTLWTAGIIAVAALTGCDSSAKGNSIPDMSTAALEIAIASSFGNPTAPTTPATPDVKVPRAQCTECNGTGTITHGDGHKTACTHCYVLYRSHQHPSRGELRSLTGADDWGWSGVGDGFVAVYGPVGRCGKTFKDLEAEKKRTFALGSPAAVHSCPCGPDCKCENCPEDCLGELITLADLKTDKASSLPIATVALATSPQSGSCTNGSCGPSKSSSGSACGTSGSGSCGSGACGSGDGAFMNRGPARRFVSRVRPVRRAAGFINRARPLRRMGGCLFGRCG